MTDRYPEQPADDRRRQVDLLVLSQMYPRPGYPTSGIFVANWIRALARRLGSVRVISPRTYVPPGLRDKPRYQHYLAPAHEVHNGIDVFRPSYIRPPGRWFSAVEGHSLRLGAQRLIRRLHAQTPADLLLAVNVIPDGDAALRIGRKLGLPVVVNAIGSDVEQRAHANRWTRSSAERVCRQADLVLCQSERLRGQVVQFGAAKDRVKTFPRGIDLGQLDDLPDRATCRSMLNLPDAEHQAVVFLGRAMRGKGVFDLVEAFARLPEALRRKTILYFVGAPEQAGELEALARERGVWDSCRMMGRRPYTEAVSLLKGADLLALPSHAEGMPNVVLEAFALGVPAIVSLVGGVPDLCETPETLLPIQPRDPEGLAAQLTAGLSERERMAEMAGRAQQLVRRRFDVHRNSEELAEILQRLTGSSRS